MSDAQWSILAAYTPAYDKQSSMLRLRIFSEVVEHSG